MGAGAGRNVAIWPRRDEMTPLWGHDMGRFGWILLIMAPLVLAIPAAAQNPESLGRVESIATESEASDTVQRVALGGRISNICGPNEIPFFRGGDPDDRSPGILTDRRLSRVVEFMSRHFAEPLTLDRLAREACLSRYHFARLFTAKVGQSPHRYLAGIRLDAARRMLETTDQSVAAIGAACGYPASSHFAAAFTARYGASPRDFRAGVKPR